MFQIAQSAAVAISDDPDARRAGLLAAGAAASKVGRERTVSALLFASGAHAADVERVAEGAAELLPDATIVVVGGVGVISNEGESEGVAAVTALALIKPITLVTGPTGDTREEATVFGTKLGKAITVERPRPMMLFLSPGPHTVPFVDAFDRAARAQVVLGGGIATSGGMCIRQKSAAPHRAHGALAVRFDGGVRLAVGVSPGVRRITDFLTVDRIEGGYIVELEGKTPLETLTKALRKCEGRPLVLAAVAPEGINGSTRDGHCLVRGIAGVDPTRGSIHIGERLRLGQRMAFATLDSVAAREDLASMMGHLRTGLGGGAALAGLYIDCAGRGQRLHGRPGVDGRLISSELKDLPFAGIRSSFEIAPFDGRTRVHTYTGVLALIYAPS
jgi:small ligand-binding sensory domain FIST